MTEKTLERIVRNTKTKIIIGTIALAGIFGYGCGPTLNVPKNVVESNEVSCCEILGCTAKGWDYCRDDGNEYKDGQLYVSCSCHDQVSSSSESSSESSSGSGFDHDRGGYHDRDYDRGGRTICVPKR